MGLSSMAVVLGIIRQVYAIDFKLMNLMDKKRAMARNEAHWGEKKAAVENQIGNKPANSVRLSYIDMNGDGQFTPGVDSRLRRPMSAQAILTGYSSMQRVGFQKEAGIDQQIQRLEAKRKALVKQQETFTQMINQGIDRAFKNNFAR